MKKEDKIKEAWKLIDPKNYFLRTLTQEGFSITYVCNGIKDITDALEIQESEIEFEYLEQDLIKFRPLSLKGIENNNGWILLNGVANEITDRCSMWIVTKNGDIEYLKENEFLPIGYATHYKKIETPKSPIY